MLRVGLIGCGFMGRMHSAVYGMLPNAKLMACVDRNPEKARAFAEPVGAVPFDSLEQMLENSEIDVLDICLPTYLHREAAEVGAAKRLHVFCEKPIALTVEDARAMQSAFDGTNRQLMIGHCIRFWPEYMHLKRIADEGTLGNLRSINLTRYGEFPAWASDNWLADESMSGGGALDMHIHDTDFALHLLGEPKTIDSWGTIDEKGPSHVFTTMQFANGAIAHLEGGWNLPTNTPFKMAFRAIFEHGAAIFDGGPLTIFAPDREPSVPTFPKMQAQGGGNITDLGGYFYELEYFFGQIEKGQPIQQATGASSTRSLEVALEEIRQAKSRALN